MIDSMNSQIASWVSDNLALVASELGVSIHIDELFGKKWEKSEIIGVSVQAFSILIEQMKKMNLPAQPVLIIPLLTKSNKLEMSSPQNLQEIEEHLDLVPPSLHLVDWLAPKRLDEEYRIRLRFSLITVPIEDVFFYYSEWRHGEDIVNNWEYSRRIYAEYHPLRPRTT